MGLRAGAAAALVGAAAAQSACLYNAGNSSFDLTPFQAQN